MLDLGQSLSYVGSICDDFYVNIIYRLFELRQLSQHQHAQKPCVLQLDMYVMIDCLVIPIHAKTAFGYPRFEPGTIPTFQNYTN